MKYVFIHQETGCVGPFDEYEHVIEYIAGKRLFGEMHIRTLIEPLPLLPTADDIDPHTGAIRRRGVPGFKRYEA